MIREDEWVAAAHSLDCDVAALKAVAAVEAPKGGFGPDGRPTILFEGHVFYRFTKGAHAVTAPDLCYPTWTKRHYALTQDGEWQRLTRARALDDHAALLSTSWGRFQIMGFNHAACGFATVEQMVTALSVAERAQLQAFVAFLKHAKLDGALRDQRWADFARGYNGPKFAENAYDTKLASAYRQALSR